MNTGIKTAFSHLNKIDDKAFPMYQTTVKRGIFLKEFVVAFLENP